MKSRLWIWAVITLFVFWVFWIFLLHPAYSLVDDGYSLSKGRAILHAQNFSDLQNTVVENQIGRFRPLYLAYFSLIYGVFGNDPIGLWFGQTVVVSLTMIIIFEIIFLLTSNHWLSLLSVFGWFAMPAVAENIFRLGTAEPRQGLLILLSLFFLLKWSQKPKKIFFTLSIIFTALAIGTKETSVMILPLQLFVFFAQKFKKKSLLFSTIGGVVVLLVGLVLGVYLLKNVFSSGYATQNFAVSVAGIYGGFKLARNNLGQYFFPILLGFSLLVGRLLMFKKRDWVSLSVGLLMLIAESIFFVIAWHYQFARYLYITWTVTVIFLTLEFFCWLKILADPKLYRRHISVITGILLISSVFVTANYIFIKGKRFINPDLVIESLDVYKRSFDSTQVTHAVANLLLNNTTVETVYTTSDNYEVIYELGLYSSQFGARKVVVVSSSQALVDDQKSELYKYAKYPVADYLADHSSQKILVGLVGEVALLNQQMSVNKIDTLQMFGSQRPDQLWWYILPETE
jgi:hypothetical protein